MLCPQMQTFIWSYTANLTKQLNMHNPGKKSDNLLFCCTHFPYWKWENNNYNDNNIYIPSAIYDDK